MITDPYTDPYVKPLEVDRLPISLELLVSLETREHPHKARTSEYGSVYTDPYTDPYVSP